MNEPMNLGSYATIIIPTKEEKINNHFFKEIFSRKKNLLKINPNGTVNCAPIIIGDNKEEASIAKYTKP